MEDKLCLFVIIGVDDAGHKEVLTVVDGHRESVVSWLEVLSRLTYQGITIAPELALGDVAFSFWNAVTKH
ncbi:hypothetical protein BTN49_2289 (plasmid) [Candidatus Enterovibrio escicola]|uniref:Mutator family transposase n=1 Tax=Candidatus Enterovibrio escicola TaxID=1927127 RepID=A0A2A5T1R9_9GAMM|nr:hypothetical protein BTN49_2289 [Candidatus Enterovibrio escacola]